MRYTFSWLLLLLVISTCSFGQHSASKVITQKMIAPSIQGNRGGEDPERQISVYLPPGYAESKQRYPVIYFLHGYLSNDTDMMEWIQFKELMDRGIAAKRIRPMIIVVPNSDTRFRGSFYTNSSLTGNWADFIAKDVVNWTDKNFRTLADRKSRGLCGHSMGGNGTIKLAMQFPDVFSVAYALSPAVLDWYGDFTLKNEGFKKLVEYNKLNKTYKTVDDLLTNWDETTFYVGVLSSLARMYSPNESSSTFQADFPVTYIGDSAIFNMNVVKKWEENFPMNMIETHLPALRSLTALKMDWGRNEEFAHIPFTALQFSKKLESFGIQHYAEEYIGDHGNKIAGEDGRVNTEMLPFFNTWLKFD